MWSLNIETRVINEAHKWFSFLIVLSSTLLTVLFSNVELDAQEVSLSVQSTYSLDGAPSRNTSPIIGWGSEEIYSNAPPLPPPGAFDMRISPSFFREILIFEDSTWYNWDLSFQNAGGFDTLYVFFDRCELLNNVREAYIVNRDSSVVIDLVSDTVATIDPSFGRRFSVWLLSKPTISDDPPTIVAPLPDAVLDPNTEIPYRINVSSFFQSTSGSRLRYSAQTNTSLVNLVTTQTGIIELTLKEGVQDTTIDVLVTAFGAGCGFAEQIFTVDIPAIINLPIELVQDLPDVEVAGDFPTQVIVSNLNDYFVDPNKTQPTFALTYNASIVNLFLSGNSLLASSIPGVFNTQVDITVTASDGEFSISDTFQLNIGEPNRAPFKTQEVPNITVDPNFGFIEAAYLNTYFEDPDGDPIVYSLAYDQALINAGVQGDTLFLASIEGIKNETINFGLTISDGLLFIEDSFEVIIRDNQPPTVVEVDTSLVLERGYDRFEWINLDTIFIDPENKELSYRIELSTQNVADFTIEEGFLVVNEIDGVENAYTQVTVTAYDRFNEVSIRLGLTVEERNLPPEVSSDRVEIALNYENGLVIPFDLNEYFSDPNSDSLDFSVITSNNISVTGASEDPSGQNTSLLSLTVDTTDMMLYIEPRVNARIDEDIRVVASDGEFEAELILMLDLYPENVPIPDGSSGSFQSNKNLYQTYPNPAQVSNIVSIVYEIPDSEIGDTDQVEIAVFNMLGQRVKTLVSKRLSSGVYAVNLDTRGLSAGIYIYTLQTNSGIISRKLTLID